VAAALEETLMCPDRAVAQELGPDLTETGFERSLRKHGLAAFVGRGSTGLG
jgi:hypothetical protein